jgi:hypothetical protein
VPFESGWPLLDGAGAPPRRSAGTAPSSRATTCPASARWLSPEATTRAGRPASALLEDDALHHDVQREAHEWVELYHAPELGDGPEELVKIDSFFRTRLRE